MNLFTYTYDEKRALVDQIKSFEKGIVVFDGPSGSGKSYLAQIIIDKFASHTRLSSEEIGEIVCNIAKGNISFNSAIESLKCEILCIEDIDMHSGRSYTLLEIAGIVNLLASDTLIIFTGIDVKDKCPKFIRALNNPKFIYFKK